MQPQVSSYQPPFNQDTESAFQLGHFDRFVDGHGEIVCSLSGFRYIFGPEAIDLGPCCDPCDENWVRVLRHEDVVKFSQGYSLSLENAVVRTARRVLIPETYDNYGNFLGVVLRERHPSSREGATAAFLCPPFGIITLHKFSFGYNSDIIWPPAVGARFWVKLDTSGVSVRVWKVEGLAEGTEFGHSSAQIGYVVPKLFLWQWNKIFNQMGIFSITDVTSKNACESGSAASPEVIQNGPCSGKSSTKSTDCQDLGKGEEAMDNTSRDSAAMTLLLDLINDRQIRAIVLEKHRKAFENYIAATVSSENT